jgi:hypothetical protein
MSTSAGGLASDAPARLTVGDVQRLYGCAPRAARRMMDAAGAFIVAGRLVVRREDLVAHEEALRAARRGQVQPAPAPPRRQRRPRRKASPQDLSALPAAFWEDHPGKEGTP